MRIETLRFSSNCQYLQLCGVEYIAQLCVMGMQYETTLMHIESD